MNCKRVTKQNFKTFEVETVIVFTFLFACSLFFFLNRHLFINQTTLHVWFASIVGDVYVLSQERVKNTTVKLKELLNDKEDKEAS